LNFEEAEKYLFSLGNEVDTMRLGLANITALLDALGKPHGQYKKVQVAGTNGKGSVCAFLNAICLEAGIRTGMYTSPHLISIRERIKIDGADISEDDFAALASRVRETSESLVASSKLERLPTFFEQVTAIALLAFAEAKVELAILETGLGGRFDATTAADADIAAITRIDLDHQEYLGATIEKIAAEKAAIIHEHSSVVIGRQPEAALRVILDRCAELDIEPNFKTYVPWTITATGSESYRVNTDRYFYPNVVLGLKGRHQAENAETALNIIQGLQYKFGFEFEGSGAIVSGLKRAGHPGRLEYIGNVLLDGAHNMAGAAALLAYLDEFEKRPVILVFGAMKDKAVKEMLAVIAPKADSIILTKPYNTRALGPDALADLLPDSVDRETVTLTHSVEEAIRCASGLFDGGIILVTGSLYLVGEVKKLLETKPSI